jgi:pimeloyl-ACP methyl ester carboxylesterase
MLNVIGPLTDPTAHGGSEDDAFHVVVPSMPGYGFSGKPTTTGWGPERIARAWATLMERLGYQRYVAQGGDWGALIVDLMGVQAPPGLLAIHTNLAGAIPPEIDAAAFAGAESGPYWRREDEKARHRLKRRRPLALPPAGLEPEAVAQKDAQGFHPGHSRSTICTFVRLLRHPSDDRSSVDQA